MTTLSELGSLKGRSALLTGAAGHIGRVISHTLGELGSNLILVDKPEADYGPLLDELRDSYGVNVSCVSCDLESEEERGRLVAWTRDSGSGLDILINNAAFVGTSSLEGWATTFELQTVKTWRRALEVNLTSVFDLTKNLAELMREGKHGSIINIGSTYGVLGPDWSLYEDTDMGNPAAYAASKGGLIQLTKWLATTLAPHTRVNAISPGGVFRNQPSAFVERYVARTPLKRMAREEDLKGAVAYLSSDLSAYVTGQNISVDGGWGIW